jgi:hypothetical protein
MSSPETMVFLIDQPDKQLLWGDKSLKW